MTGKIDVNCVISKDFSGDLVVKTKAIVKNMKQSNVFEKGYGNLQVKIKHEFSFDTLQSIAANRRMLDHLDDKGGIMFYGLDAEFVQAKAKNSDREYKVILVNFGTKEKPLIRCFYLNDKHENTLKAFQLEYPFTRNQLVFEIIQSIFTFIYPKLKYVPLWIWIPALVLALFFKAISRAEYKLKKHHERLKEFANDELTQTTFINGPPGTGKTLLNVSLSLASEENYIEESEKALLDSEMQYKYLNFATIRQNPKDFPEHKKYIDTYELLNNRGTFLISNYSIYSPLFNEYSKIFNFDYMRVNKKTDYYPVDEYIVISLSEFDKEYNSHDNKKEVGEDGAATFFSTVSHNLKRHTKIFVDYQLKDQVRPEATTRIQSSLVLEQIAKEENIEVTDADIDAEVEKMAKAYGMEADKLKEYMGDAEKESMKKDLAITKAVDLIMDNVKERAKAKKKADAEESTEE